MTKEELRKELKRERGKVPQENRLDWDRAIFEHITDLPAYKQAEKVMIYLSFGWEIDTWSIVNDLQAKGKQVYVPVVRSNPKSLIATAYTSREDLTPAIFGILEPGPDAPTIRPEELNLVIVPGLAFSSQGFRIGYGGGYYDRFLITTKAETIGLVYGSFVRDLPADSWDQPVNFLITEEGLMGRK